MRHWTAVLLALMIGFAMSCKETSTDGKKVTVEDLNPVLERHSAEIMSLPGVTGIAIGAMDDGTPCILVLILEDSEEIKSRIPKTLEGHPVQTMVTGLIEPMRTDSGG